MQARQRKRSRQQQTNTNTKTEKCHLNDDQNEFLIRSNFERIVLISLATRFLSVLLVQTYFVPDEYWQSLEIAHLKVFGYGYETWEWIEGIRGYTYPLFICILYKLLRILCLDYTFLLIYAPRILQAILTTFADVKLFAFAKALFGTRIAFYAYFLHLSSWFIFYTSSRTLTNTIEMALIVIALGSYHWKIFLTGKSLVEHYSSPFLGLFFCGLSCVIRPTAVITWLPILLSELYHDVIRKNSFYFLKIGVITALVLLSTSTLLDYLFYGKFIIVHWRFLQFNFMQNLSGFYGSHPWHWYLTQGIPVALFTHLLPFLVGVFTCKAKEQASHALLLVIAMQLIFLSVIEHKEFRFLLPSLPFMVCLAGKGLNRFVHGPNDTNQRETKEENVKQGSFVKSQTAVWTLAIIAVLNSLLALYTGLVHQRGTLDVMKYLRSDLGDEKKDAVLFLMPCHSTPYYSHIHMNVSMRFLECPPNLESGYTEEADQFYQNSTEWLNFNYSHESQRIPSHIVFFNVLLENSDVTSFLKRNGFAETARFFHTHFPEGRVGSHVVVFSSAARK